jgi:hypothetical protein
MGKPKLKSIQATAGQKAIRDLKKGLPPAVVSRSRGHGHGCSLMVVCHEETRQALKVRAAKEETTVRALILQALADAGYPVPDDGFIDRRRRDPA